MVRRGSKNKVVEVEECDGIFEAEGADLTGHVTYCPWSREWIGPSASY